MPRTSLILAAIVIAVAGCSSAPSDPGGSPGTGASGPKPSFQLTLDGMVSLPAYTSDDAASLATCEPAEAGGWTYMYAGGSPFVSVDLSIYAGVVDGRTPGDFDLDIGAPAGQVRLVPSGRREGAKGDGTAVIEETADAVTITVNGAARTMRDGSNAGDTTVDLVLTCPR